MMNPESDDYSCGLDVISDDDLYQLACEVMEESKQIEMEQLQRYADSLMDENQQELDAEIEAESVNNNSNSDIANQLTLVCPLCMSHYLYPIVVDHQIGLRCEGMNSCRFILKSQHCETHQQLIQSLHQFISQSISNHSLTSCTHPLIFSLPNQQLNPNNTSNIPVLSSSLQTHCKLCAVHDFISL
mmetsp:Transcript_354/g.639  ORF Transcript_354/g.639 Transcript_354/m.639 type:complete len:186 (-) Transcript_354:1479-2036(-)